MSEVQITTPCPACGGKTLFVSPQGHICCSLLTCQEPGLFANLAALRENLIDLEHRINGILDSVQNAKMRVEGMKRP